MSTHDLWLLWLIYCFTLIVLSVIAALGDPLVLCPYSILVTLLQSQF